MKKARRICAGALCALLVCAIIPFGAFTASNGVLTFTVEGGEVNPGEQVTLEIRASNISANGLASALVGLEYGDGVSFVSAQYNSALAGQKMTGTKDIAKGDRLVRRLMWVGDDKSAMYGDFLFATVVLDISADAAPGSVLEIGLEISADERNYLDKNGDGMAASSVGCSLTVHSHTLTHVEAASFCETQGNIEYWRCETCGKYYSDAVAENEISADDIVVSPTGHAWGKWSVLTEASCDVAGLRARVCANDPSHIDNETIPPLGHKLKYIDAVEPTAEENGNIAYWECEVCQRRFTDADAAYEIVPGDEVLIFEPELGDVNSDGRLNARDVEMTMRHMTGWSFDKETVIFDPSRADMNGDNKLNARDVIILLKTIATREAEIISGFIDTGSIISVKPYSANAFGDPTAE